MNGKCFPPKEEETEEHGEWLRNYTLAVEPDFVPRRLGVAGRTGTRSLQSHRLHSASPYVARPGLKQQ